MRTAKEYAEMWKNLQKAHGDSKEGLIKSVTHIANAFLQEAGREIGKIPMPASGKIPIEKHRAVLLGQDQKWRRLAELTHDLSPDGFEILLKSRAPFMYNLLKHSFPFE